MYTNAAKPNKQQLHDDLLKSVLSSRYSKSFRKDIHPAVIESSNSISGCNMSHTHHECTIGHTQTHTTTSIFNGKNLTSDDTTAAKSDLNIALGESHRQSLEEVIAHPPSQQHQQQQHYHGRPQQYQQQVLVQYDTDGYIKFRLCTDSGSGSGTGSGSDSMGKICDRNKDRYSPTSISLTRSEGEGTINLESLVLY